MIPDQLFGYLFSRSQRYLVSDHSNEPVTLFFFYLFQQAYDLIENLIEKKKTQFILVYNQ